MTTKKSLYEKDFCAWSKEQALLLKKRDVKHLDIEHLILEIKDLGGSYRSAIESYLSAIICHMLKKEYDPESQGNSRSWDALIENSRLKIKNILKKNPSLKREIPGMLGFAYKVGKTTAFAESHRLDKDIFPEKCPWGSRDILG